MTTELKICQFCDSTNIETATKTVDGKEVGLPGVVLENLPVTHCMECNETVYDLPPTGALSAIVSRAIAQSRDALAASDFATLRKNIGLTGKSFAAMIGVSNVSVSRWENGQVAVPRSISALVRVLALLSADVRNMLVGIIRHPSRTLPTVDCSLTHSILHFDFVYEINVAHRAARRRNLGTESVANDPVYLWYPQDILDAQ